MPAIKLDGSIQDLSIKTGTLKIESSVAKLDPIVYAIKSRPHHALGFLGDDNSPYEQLVDIWFACTAPDFTLDQINTNSVVTVDMKYDVQQADAKIEKITYSLKRYPHALENLYLKIDTTHYLYKLTVGNPLALSQIHLTKPFFGSPFIVMGDLLAYCGFTRNQLKLNIKDDGDERWEYCEGNALDCFLQILRRNGYVAYFDNDCVLQIIEKATYAEASYTADSSPLSAELQRGKERPRASIANFEHIDRKLERTNINNGAKAGSRAHKVSQIYTATTGTTGENAFSHYHMDGATKYLDRVIKALRSAEMGPSKLFRGSAVAFPVIIATTLQSQITWGWANDKKTAPYNIVIRQVALNIGFLPPKESTSGAALVSDDIYYFLAAAGVSAGINFNFTAIPDTEVPYLRYSPASENRPILLEAIVLNTTGTATGAPEKPANREIHIGLLAENLKPAPDTKYTNILTAGVIEQPSLQNATLKPGTQVYVLYYPKTGALLVTGVKHFDAFVDELSLSQYFSKVEPTQTVIKLTDKGISGKEHTITMTSVPESLSTLNKNELKVTTPQVAVVAATSITLQAAAEDKQAKVTMAATGIEVDTKAELQAKGKNINLTAEEQISTKAKKLLEDISTQISTTTKSTELKSDKVQITTQPKQCIVNGFAS